MIEYRVINALQTRVRDMARSWRPGHEPDPSWYEFRVAPTCPPSTSLVIRGGMCCADKSDFSQDWSDLMWQVPDITRDLANPDHLVWSSMGYDSAATVLTWNNAGWFRYCVVVLALPESSVLGGPAATDWRLRLKRWKNVSAALAGYDIECETAGGAEAALGAFLSTYTMGDNPWPWGDDSPAFGDPPGGMPLCGLILRHDGSSDMTSFLPIDLVNRGRSYMWPRDLRPRWEYA